MVTVEAITNDHNEHCIISWQQQVPKDSESEAKDFLDVVADEEAIGDKVVSDEEQPS